MALVGVGLGVAMQFDARQAKALRAGDHMTVPDAPGLRLVCSTAGRAWVYRFKSQADDRMRQVKLGAWPVMSASQAGAEWDRLRSMRDAGRDPAAERRAARRQVKASAAAARDENRHGRHTVARLMKDYIELHAAGRRAPKGLAELRRTVDTMLGPVADLAPESITRAIAYTLISGYKATPVQASSLRREMGAAWEWAHDSGRLGDEVPNWWRQILRGQLASAGKIVGGKHQGVVKRVLSVADVGMVLRHLPHVSRLVSDLITMYLWTGCRGAEIVAIEGREVARAVDGWWWTIPKMKLKMARNPLTTDLRVPLVGRSLAIVQSRMDVHGSGPLFPPVRGKAVHVDQKVIGVGVWWHQPGCKLHPEQVRPRWPVSDWAPHDLRRTVRTQLAGLGCPSDVAEAVLGHLQPGVEGVYNRHHYDAERREWLTRLAVCWEAAAGR